MHPPLGREAYIPLIYLNLKGSVSLSYTRSAMGQPLPGYEGGNEPDCHLLQSDLTRRGV